jgi:hypothetical protein
MKSQGCYFPPVVVILAVDLELSQTRQAEETKKMLLRIMMQQNGVTKYTTRALREENQQRPTPDFPNLYTPILV